MEIKSDIKKESNKYLWITGIILIVFLIAVITNGFGLLNNPNPKAVNLTIGNSPVLGNPDAKITIYLFSDFSCTYCAQFAIQTIPEVITNYVDTGKAKLVFKYFPTHATAEAAHKVAFCLNQQNLFWKFHDLAFSNQQNLNDLSNVKSMALSLGANSTKLDSCLSSTDFNSEFQKDIAIAKANALRGTPSLIINDQIYEGALSYQDIKKILDKIA